MSENKCCHTVRSNSIWDRGHACGRKGKVCIDGRWYCGIHDPVKKAEKRKERDERWKAEWEESKRVSRLNREAQAMLDMLKRIDCVSGTTIHSIGVSVKELIPEIRALIKRAEGGDNE